MATYNTNYSPRDGILNGNITRCRSNLDEHERWAQIWLAKYDVYLQYSIEWCVCLIAYLFRKHNLFKYMYFASKMQPASLAQSVGAWDKRDLLRHPHLTTFVYIFWSIISHSFIDKKSLKFKPWQDFSMFCIIYS